jgi:hypothetical protein
MALSFQTTLALAAAVANNIAASQSPGAGAITLNGTVGTGNLDAARRILITSGGNDSGITFTVNGVNRSGFNLSETITGGNIAGVFTTQDFLSVSSVTHTGSVAGTVTVGTNGVASSPWFSADLDVNPFALGIGVVVSGTINYTVEFTFDDLNTPYTGTFPTVFPWGPMTNQTTNQTGTLNGPARALRVTQNSFTSPGKLYMIVVQPVLTP